MAESSPSIAAISEIADSDQIRVVLFINNRLVHVSMPAFLTEIGQQIADLGEEIEGTLEGYVTLTGVETITNKTLTSPVIDTPTVNAPTLTLKADAAPSPTVEGDIQWDTDDNVLVIGDGAATQTFIPIPGSTEAGDILYFGGEKAYSRLPKGTAYQTLRMNSGATAPEWGTPLANVAYDGEIIATWEYSSTVTVVDFTDLGAYSRLQVIFDGIVIDSAANPLLRVSTDNGSTFLNSGYDSFVANDGSGATYNTGLGLADGTVTEITDGVVYLDLFNANTRAVYSGISGGTHKVSGRAPSGTNDALQFTTNIGANITAGKIVLKGWRPQP